MSYQLQVKDFFNLKFLISKLRTDQLLKGSFIIFIGSIIVGFGNYLFQIIMGRMLGPEDFGILAALLSISLIIAIPTQAINHVLAKYTSQFEGEGKNENIWPFIIFAIKKASYYGILASIFFIALSPLIANFLHIPSVIPVIILGFFFLFSFLKPIGMGALRGLQKFTDLTKANILFVFLKILFAIALVYFGFGVNGAIFSLVIGAIIFILYIFAKLLFCKNNHKENFKEYKFLKFVGPVLFATICLVVLYNIDVILAKHFLSSEEAGYYAVISLLGKIIFFATGAIGTVIFPIASKRFNQGKDTTNLFKLGLSIVSIISIIITAIYFILPKLVVKTLFGATYLAIIPYTGLIGIIFIIYSLINIIVLYNLSIQRTDFIWLLILGTALEIALLSYYHQDIQQILMCLIVSMSLILATLTIYLKFKKYNPQITKTV